MCSRYIIIVVLVALHVNADNKEEVLKKLTLNIGQKLFVCRDKVNITESLAAEFTNIWNFNHALKDRDLGCAILCIFNTFQLMDQHGKIDEPKISKLLIDSGADDEMIVKILELCDTCKGRVGEKNLTDTCTVMLQFFDCLRNAFFFLGWMPLRSSVNISFTRPYEFRRFKEGEIQEGDFIPDQFINNDFENVDESCRRNVPVDSAIDSTVTKYIYDEITTEEAEFNQTAIKQNIKERKSIASGLLKEANASKSDQIAVSISYDDPSAPITSYSSIDNESTTETITEKIRLTIAKPANIHSESNDHKKTTLAIKILSETPEADTSNKATNVEIRTHTQTEKSSKIVNSPTISNSLNTSRRKKEDGTIINIKV